MRRKILAVVKSVEHFHVYLHTQNFSIRADHAALQWLMNFKNVEGQMARWVQKLQQYDFVIEYRQWQRTPFRAVRWEKVKKRKQNN